MTETLSAVDLANDRMSILTACNMVGVEVGDFRATSMKMYCPFGELTHADGGMAKAFRVYPTSNSAYCFAGCGFFTPVKLLATEWGISDPEAAERILDETGYVPPDYTSRWDALMSEAPSVNTDDLADALKVYCATIDPLWEVRQFEPPIATKLRQCLTLTGKVRTAEQAAEWLRVTKLVMQQVIGETP